MRAHHRSNELTERQEDEVSLFGLASMLLRWRRPIVVLAFLGGILGIAVGLLPRRVYVSSATFIPQPAEGSLNSGLLAAASQLGVSLPGATGNAWGPPIYVDLLQSDALLKPIALDTLLVPEVAGRRVPLSDLLQVRAPTLALQTERTVRALRNLIAVTDDARLGAVNISVTTAWPTVSLALAQQLVTSVNQFNVRTRQSQAAAERKFVEQRVQDAEDSLRAAEDSLQAFLERNRAVSGSPQLEFTRDRLQRAITMRQALYSTLMQSLEQAKIREVRDTPVITVLQPPQLPLVPASRRLAIKAVLGAFAGGVMALLFAFLFDGLDEVDRTHSYLERLRTLTPRFLKRK